MVRRKTEKNKKQTPKQTRESWITAAFETLITEGISQVRVERLAKKIGVTKGSFYWHFKDRTDLLDGLLDYWASEMTQTVLDYAQMFHGDPVERIYSTLEEIIGKEKAAFDPQFRAWAGHDQQAKRVVDQIDKIRLTFLRGLFEDIGFTEDMAEIRARLMYYYIIGEHFISDKEPMYIRLKKLKMKIDLLVQSPELNGIQKKETKKTNKQKKK